MTYSWSVSKYCRTTGPRVRAIIPETPHPSSRTDEDEESAACLKRTLFEDEIQPAKEGVILHTTEKIISSVI